MKAHYWVASMESVRAQNLAETKVAMKAVSSVAMMDLMKAPHLVASMDSAKVLNLVATKVAVRVHCWAATRAHC